MKIKLLCCTLLCIMHIHGMQNVVDNPEKQQAEHIIVNMMSSSEEQPVIGEKKDGVVEKIGNLVSGNSESQNNNSRIDASARSSQVPNLNLNSSLPLRRYQSATIEKKPIKKTADLAKNVNKIAQTARTPIPTARAPHISTSLMNFQDTVIPMTTVPNRGVSPSISVSQDNNDAVVVRTYTEDEVWDILSIANPVLYNFAVEHQLPLDQALIFGELKSKLDISPDAVVDFVKSRLPENKKGIDWNQSGKYQKLQRKDPQKYKEIIYEMMKAIVDEQDEQTKSSPLADTHIQLAEKQIAGQDGTIKKQWVGIAATLLSGIGMLTWALYGQITAHTAAPTNTPTNAPTMFPTGSPT